ncbi:choice-of-anchor J domain-containing protein [Peribacillus glennii]|uniref:Peptidase M6 n=1 Tax=Peribacillus glennii TaxID=2303991 RepID=A0A372L683_9BACI|nr:choice-of-anchor J domain-containing protein [Peribacillus glennii]RFU60482.1 peptidase M6 [Peribacillus glennii]
MKKKLLSVLSTGALTLSLFAPAGLLAPDAKAATSNWNTERYGDKVDIDSYLNNLSKDESYMEKADEKIKEQAENINFNEDTGSGNTAGKSHFTYDGGTKKFLNRNLKFKDYTLRSVGENVEIWVANDLSFPAGDPRPAQVVTQAQVDKLKDEFDANIYPKATDFFGTPDVHDGSHSPLAEWGNVPKGYYEGSDKVIMLVDNIIDDNYNDPSYPFFVAGFYWQTLENYIDRNIITIDARDWDTRLENTFYGTTIHELQHLIHADNDGDEESWLNEGMSTFSEYLGGYGHDDRSINFYLDHPENSLVNWDEHQGAATGPETIADYGQVYLFTLYMNDKFGKEFIRNLALNETNGLDSVNETLNASGQELDFKDVYNRFITALAIDSEKPGNGIYNFDSINLRDLAVDNNGTKRGSTINYETVMPFEKEGVPAWGGDFKQLDNTEKIRNISFDGIDFLPVPWESITSPTDEANNVLWGNKGDEADNSIILEADLTNVKNATLNFDNYYKIEEQWDFAAVQVSTDGGKSWKSLSNENTRSDVVEEGYPTIKENLPGFTGQSNGWEKESFDLTEYAGRKILVSFRYMTDWGTTEDGWFIDNITIPEIGYSHEGSSTDSFKSLDEIFGKYVEYTVTFINEKTVGEGTKAKTEYKVTHVEPFNVTEEKALQLRKAFKKGENYMITTYAAPANKKNPVDFTYEIEYKKNKQK